MPRKYTEARKNGNRKWDSENLDRISIALPKGRRDVIKAHADSRGESMNGFIGRAIDETMEHDREHDIAVSIAEEHGITVQKVLESVEFGRVLDRYPDLKEFALGPKPTENPPDSK